VTGVEAGLAVAKALGPKVGMAAFRRLHPDDWERRLAKSAARDAKQGGFRVSRRRVRKWLKADDTDVLVDAFVVSGAGGASDEAAASLDRVLRSGRRWRRLPEGERLARSGRVVRAVADGLIRAQLPSDAVDVASRRTSAQLSDLRAELAEGRAAGNQAEFELALGRLPLAARESLARLSESAAGEAVRRVVMSVGDVDAQPTALIPVWVSEPPPWLSDDAAGWTALGALAEEYLFVGEAADCWVRAAEHGSPRRDYWLMRAAWLLFEQSLPGEDDEALARVGGLVGRVGRVGDGFGQPVSALRALIDGRAGEVPGLLAGWAPVDVADRCLQTRMLFVAALAAINDGAGSLADAAASLKAAFDIDPLPRTGLMLSRAMVAQAYAEPAADRVDLLVSAYDIAVQVRDMLRAVRAPSLPAVKAAVEAAEMGTDERRILRVATDWPEYGGEANEQERGNIAVAPAVVAAALLFGLSGRAREYAEGLPPGYERSLCLAMCTDLPGTALSAEQRRAMWSDVLVLGRNPSERMPAWDGLARAGATELPGMREQIGDTKPAVATGLEATAAAARGFHDEAVRMLLPHARADMTAARQLAKIYDDHGEQVNAARTLLDAGVDFHNPDLVVHAAEILFENGEHADAKDAIDRVLAEHGPEWSSRPVALWIAARIAEGADRLDTACDYLAAALRLDPSHVNGRWFLVQLLCQRGLSGQAWQTIIDAPAELPVHSVNEARAWLDACYHGGPGGEAFVVGGLRLIDQFPDEERLAAAVLMNGIGIQLSEPVLADYQAAFARFLQTWPHSAALRQVPFPSDDPDKMRAVLDRMSAPSDEERETVTSVAGQVQAGRMPLAVLAAMLHVTYTETLIERAAGLLVAMSLNDTFVGVETARAALDGDVVADLPALHIVAELVDDQPDLAGIVDVAHRQVSVTEAVARDITLGSDALARPKAGTWMPPAGGNPGYFSPVTDAERNRIARCSSQLQQRLARHRTVPNPATVTVLGERTHDTDLAVWDRTVQVANDRRQPLWSDDVVTRTIARDAGVPAFSTLDLLTALAQRGSITAAQMQRARQCLLVRGIADVPLTASALRDAAAADDWQTGYAGAALSRPEAWKNPSETVRTWTAFIRGMPRVSYHRLPSWTYVATFGAARAPYVLGAAAARTIVAQLISTVVFLAASNPAVVANCILGSADAVTTSGVTVDDPLPLAVQSLRDTLSNQLPPEQVVPYLLTAFSQCPDAVQSIVRRSLLQ
jgi:tetratricopeptide (TPR) repeat protein